MKKIVYAVAALLTGVLLLSPSASAVNVFKNVDCATASESAVCAGKDEDATTIAQTVTSILMWSVGVISVIMTIVGGMMYILSNGDAAKTKKAKDTILYSVVGLVVAIVAAVIVQFVANNVGK